VAKRNSGRRGRPRRRGAPVASPAPEAQAEPPAPATTRAAKRRERPRRAELNRPGPRAHRDPGGVGERPQAPWHPWPLSELLILVGAIGTLVGVLRGDGGPVLFAGLGAVLLGTLDFTIREHLAGYRAHTVMLAAMPTALLHAAVAVALYSLGAPRVSWIVVPLAVDVPVFWVIFRPLRARFEDARHRRVLELARR